VNEFIVGRDCLQGGAPGTFNLWVSINPPVSDTSASAVEADVTTQFFNTAAIDMSGADRNALCAGPGGAAGCIIDIPLASAHGMYDVRLLSVVSTSTIAALPSDCSLDPTLPLADLHSQAVVYGGDPHDGQVLGAAGANAIAAAMGGPGYAEKYEYAICPRGLPDATGAFVCTAGTTYAPLQVLLATGLADFASDDNMVVGQPNAYHHQLFAAAGSDACNRITSVAGATENWSGFSTFNVQICAVSPFPEMTGTNNCDVIPVRLVVSEPSGTSNATTAQYDSNYSSSEGADVIGVEASFYTHNDADLSGATTDTQIQAKITGWFGFSLFSVWATGASNVAIQGSYINAGAELLGQTYYSYNQSLPSAMWAENLTYAKSIDWYYNYGVAGIGLDVDAGVTGSIGLSGTLQIAAQLGAGAPPFDSATAFGSAVATVSPGVSLVMNATATVNLAVTKGEVDGQLTLLNVQLPAVGNLNWGLTATPSLVLAAQSSLKMALSTLSGQLHASVDLLQPHWCKDRIGIHYPCARWSTVWDDDIVSFKGVGTNAVLYTQPQVQVTLL
jgi:hypothetical protein